jgi:hypothetical protein
LLSDTEKRARIEKALRLGGNTHAVEDIVDLVRNRRAQLWENDGGVVVTEVNAYPRKKAVHLWLIAGRMADCLALEPEIEAWAIGQGCTIATAQGRRGWERFGPRLGWRPWYPTWWKPLEALREQ